jgi:hypothetical protein
MNINLTLQDHGINTTSLDVLIEYAETSIYYLMVSGHEAVATWHQLRQLISETAHWPVILGNSLDVSSLLAYAIVPEREVLQAVLQLSAVIDPAEWFAQQEGLSAYPDSDWFDQVVIYERQQLKAHNQLLGYGEDENDPLREIDLYPSSTSYYFRTRFDREPGRVRIGLIPTMESWQVPAFLGYSVGGPKLNPALHTSILRRWKTQYGAEVVTIADRLLQLYATRPPQSLSAAVPLAWEHGVYCPGLIDEEPLLYRTAAVLREPLWSFGWD